MPRRQLYLNNAPLSNQDIGVNIVRKSFSHVIDLKMSEQKEFHAEDKVISENSKEANSPQSISNNLVLGSDIQVYDVSPVIAVSAPVLVGKLSIEGDFVIWNGEWGMTEDAFKTSGITSKFEMKSLLKTNEGIAIVDSAHHHPACVGYPPIKLSSHTELNVSVTSPIFHTYKDSKFEELDCLPVNRRFYGFFNIKNTNPKDLAKAKATGEEPLPIVVKESDVCLWFGVDPTDIKLYRVYGRGSNKYGSFNLRGTYNSDTQYIKVYKIYCPKVVKPKVSARKVRTPRLSTSKAKGSTKKSTPKLKVPLQLAQQRAVEVTTDNISPQLMNHRPSLVRTKSERKRSLPAHLREEETNDGSPKLSKCAHILKYLIASQYSSPFMMPVDPLALNIPDYFTVISNPMDLGTIQQKMDTAVYTSSHEFASDIRLVFNNAITYNKPDHVVHIWACKLLEIFDKKYMAVKRNNIKDPVKVTIPSVEEVTFQPSPIKVKKHRSKKETDGDSLKEGQVSKSGKRKNSKLTEIEMMKRQIEMMKQEIANLSGSGTPIPASADFNIPITPKNRVSDVKEKKEDTDIDKPMTYNEKRQLSMNINNLPQSKLARVLQIIQERVPIDQRRDSDEIEVDINSFDTRTLRVLQSYVESCVGSKRKRGPSTNPRRPRRTKAEMERARLQAQQQAQVPQIRSSAELSHDKNSSAGSSDSSSDSSDTDSASASDSDTSDDEIEAQQPSVLKASTLLNPSSMLHDVSRSSTDDSAGASVLTELPIKDKGLSETVKVENHGAWSLLVSSTDGVLKGTGKSFQSGGSLWSTARSEEQKKKQREEELVAQQNRLVEARKKENAEELQKLEKQKKEIESASRLELEQRVQQAEKDRESNRAAARAEREKEEQSVNLDEQGDMMFSMEEEFGSSSFSKESSFE